MGVLYQKSLLIRTVVISYFRMVKYIQNPKYQTALELRQQGKSYGEISAQLGIAKSTLSYWFSKNQWSASIKDSLNLKWSSVSREKMRKLNQERLVLVQQRHQKYRQSAREQFGYLVKNPLFLLGLALYWGEGNKTNNGRVGVINTDSRLLKKVVLFYRKVLKIPEEKLRAELFIYEDHESENMKLYWSNELSIPVNQFIKTQILPSRTALTKRRAKYGMCSVYFSSTEFSIKMHEWISVLATTSENSSAG